jgi:carbonic anhydrase
MIDRFALFLLPLAVVSCGGAPPASPSASAHWSYDGEDGPTHWAAMDPTFAACGTGEHQSPIDLPTHPTVAGKAPAPPHWDPIPIRVINTGHTIQVDDTAPSSFVFEGTTYTLKNFHFHVPAEHTIGGVAADAEIHFLHQSADGKTLVVALLVHRGRENELLLPLLDAMPAVARPEPIDLGRTIDVAALLPKTPSWLRYDGSKTAPPCTEGVTWLIAAQGDVPLQMSDAQIGRLRSAMRGPSNRPLQPLNGRVVTDLVP